MKIDQQIRRRRHHHHAADGKERQRIVLARRDLLTLDHLIRKQHRQDPDRTQDDVDEEREVVGTDDAHAVSVAVPQTAGRNRCPTSPMSPRPAIGMRSPRCRNASASMAAAAESPTMTMGMIPAYSLITAFSVLVADRCSLSVLRPIGVRLAACDRDQSDLLHRLRRCPLSAVSQSQQPAAAPILRVAPSGHAFDRLLDRRFHRTEEEFGTTPMTIAIAIVGTIRAHSRGSRSGSERFFAFVTSP